ncbi:MAG: hypothetical protein IT530_16125 [Burkholderiales bacterium]|nr:hypothetical protein [Burkholderiales bacterium]
MRLTCPACGAEMTLDVAIAHEGARAATLTALELPAPLGKQLVQYVALFRPGKRQLSHDRLAAILGELLPMIQAAQIERNGRTWPAPIEYWRAGIEAMLAKRDADRLQLPLKSHGYLLEIIAGMAHAAEGKAETKREQERAYPYSRAHITEPTMQAATVGIAPMPNATRASIDKILRRGGNGDS